MNIIIFDFEVFKYDTLLGCIVVNDNGIRLYQTWDLEEMRMFYNQNKRSIWIGHNSDGYDNHILKYIVDGGKDVFKKSKAIINQKIRGKAELDVLAYDLMCCTYYSLKVTELLVGKKIHTTDVDFDIDRPLTLAEKQLEEEYNYDDLDQTYSNFLELKDQMVLRLSLLSEFNIDKKYFTATEAKLATLALGAKQIPGIEYKHIAPIVYDTLQVKNQDVMNFYLSEGFRKGQRLDVTLCGVLHTMGSGGLHGARKKCYATDFLYLDVSGYYNLIMILYDLLPRTIPQKGKELYKYMYEQQLLLKGKPELATKRTVYKTILLSVFGASMNEYTDFYDPQVGSLITIVGQMFAVDLLEKLEGKIYLIQTNTDGIMCKPLPGYTDDDILAIVKEWCNRTGFVIKPKKIDEIYQRDVNCYIYNEGNSGSTKGDIFSASYGVDQPVLNKFYQIKECPAISFAVKQYFRNGISIEETIESIKHDLRYFQFITRKNTYDYCQLEETDLRTKEKTVSKIDDTNRVFASKDKMTESIIVKYKTRNGKTTHSKLANMPSTYFIYNDNITTEQAKNKLSEKIDYQYYIDKAYERVQDIYEFARIKDVIL